MQTVRIGHVEIGEGRPCIIVPLTAASLDGVMDEAMALAELPADLAEWRIDMLEGAVKEGPEGPMPDLTYILQVLAGLRTVLPVALLATFRTQEEGGACPMSDAGYEALCRALCESCNIDLLDVEAFHCSGRAADIVAYAHERRIVNYTVHTYVLPYIEYRKYSRPRLCVAVPVHAFATKSLYYSIKDTVLRF
jgi:3-dehydroquinate dehydratase-1